MLETALEFAVVPVCALNSSSASSAARPLAGWDGRLTGTRSQTAERGTLQELAGQEPRAAPPA